MPAMTRAVSGHAGKAGGQTLVQPAAGVASTNVAGPGKQTLTAQLDRDGALLDAGAARVHASQGICDAASSLPHLSTIQRAFGRHDGGAAKAQVGGATVAVQRKADEATPPSPAHQRHMLELYLAAHQLQVWRLVGDHARSVTFPDPAARLSWTDPRTFVRALLMQLEAHIADFTPLAKLDEILHPSTAAHTVGALLPPTDAWSPPLGLAIAQALQIAIVSSLRRLGPRYLAVADAAGSSGEGAVSPGALVYSMPIDRFVGAAMCPPRVLAIEPPAATHATAAAGPFAGLRSITLAWEGARDPQLWNWVHATEPADASAEEVAATLWAVTDRRGERSAAFNAYLLAAAPPLFGIPKQLARHHPSAQRYAPADALRGDDSVDAALIDVARSSAADGIALHQSPVAAAAPARGKATPAEPPPDLGSALALLGDCDLQLGFAIRDLASWGLADRLAPAVSFVARKQHELLTADARVVSDWHPVIAGQRDRLFEIAGAIHRLARTAHTLGVRDPKAPAAGPVREILELLATAAGTSQLAQTSKAKLQQALELQAGLNVRAVQATERDLEGAHLDFSATMGPQHAKGIAGFSHDVIALQDRSRQLQTTMINGGEVDPAEFDEVTLRSSEIALRERVLGTIHSTFELEAAAISAKDGLAAHIAMLFSGKFRDLGSLCQHLRDRVVPIQNELLATELATRDRAPSKIGTPADEASRRAARRAAIARAQAALTKISLDEDLQKFFREGAKLVQHQQLRTACVKAAALIGIAVLAAATGGAAAELAGGMLMEAEGVATVGELSSLARAGVTTASVVADSAVNAAGQGAVQGGSLSQAFVENLFMSFASTALFGTIARASAETARLEGREAMTWSRASTLAHKALVIGKEAGAISVHTVWGAAIGYVAHRAVSGHAPSPMQARDCSCRARPSPSAAACTRRSVRACRGSSGSRGAAPKPSACSARPGNSSSSPSPPCAARTPRPRSSSSINARSCCARRSKPSSSSPPRKATRAASSARCARTSRASFARPRPRRCSRPSSTCSA
jgi:hypothetical protein